MSLKVRAQWALLQEFSRRELRWVVQGGFRLPRCRTQQRPKLIPRRQRGRLVRVHVAIAHREQQRGAAAAANGSPHREA